MSAHIFNIENDQWRSLRQKVSPAFTCGKIKTMFNTISDVADELLNVIDKKMKETGQFELKETFARFAIDVIGSAAFGIDCNSLNNSDSKFYDIGTSIFKKGRPRLISRLMRTVFKDLSRKLHVKAIPSEVSEFINAVTKATLDYRESNPSFTRQDFMNTLIEMKKENILTFEQIAAQSLAFYIAG